MNLNNLTCETSLQQELPIKSVQSTLWVDGKRAGVFVSVASPACLKPDNAIS